MNPLHHDRPVDDGQGTVPAAPSATPAPATTPSRLATVERAPAQQLPTQRRGAAPLPRTVGPLDGAAAPDSAVPDFVDAALAGLAAEPVVTAPRPRRGRHRVPVQRRTVVPAACRRPAFFLAAGLLGALTVGALVDGHPTARAEAAPVAESVSVADQLGIDATATAALPADPESTRRLQELVVSRNQREAASTAAADAQAAADVSALAAAAEAFRPKAVAPVDGARLTSAFGARWGSVHAGIDLAAPMRTPEYAVMDGVVLEAGPAGGYGLVVYIQHDDGDVTVYGHMDQILVRAGQVVRAGDTIALLGNRGQSTGPHLHFEVHRGGLNGTRVDPIVWLRERGVHL